MNIINKYLTEKKIEDLDSVKLEGFEGLIWLLTKSSHSKEKFYKGRLKNLENDRVTGPLIKKLIADIKYQWR